MTATAALPIGTLLDGVVVSGDAASGTVTVRVQGREYAALQMAPIMASLLGYRLRHTPPVGTLVAVVALSNNQVYVVGAFPGSDGATPSVGGGRVLDSVTPIDYDKLRGILGQDGVASADTIPEDLLEGELDLRNAMDCGLTLLAGLTRLQAGSRAVVETCLMNDMVRLVSATFRHHSSLGDQSITADGNRSNLEFTGSRLQHELFGAVKSSDSKDPNLGQDGSIDPSKTKDTDGMRARISAYVGHLGDFINLFVHDPGHVLGSTAIGTAGKFRVHVGDNGGLLVQSVADISLERVIRIPVPVRRKTEDDPTGDEPNMSGLPGDPLKPWSYEGKDMHHACYQLREMSRWLGQYYSMGKFHQLQKDWYVPPEGATQEPAPFSDEEKQKVGVPEKYMNVYACIRIMRDGSIVVHDGTGGSIVMGNGDVRVSCVKNMHLQAGGNMVLEAGQDILVKGGRHAEISTVTGELVAISKTGTRIISEAGAIGLISSAQPFIDGKKDGQPFNPTDPDSPKIQIPKSSGIYMQSASEVNVECRGTFTTVVDDLAGMPASRPRGVMFKSKVGGFVVEVQRNIRFWSKSGYITFKSARDFIVNVWRSLFTSNTVALGKGVVVRGQVLDATNVRASNVRVGGRNVQGTGDVQNEAKPQKLGFADQDTPGTFSLNAALEPGAAGDLKEVSTAENDKRDMVFPVTRLLTGCTYIGHLELTDWHSGLFDYETLSQQWLRTHADGTWRTENFDVLAPRTLALDFPPVPHNRNLAYPGTNPRMSYSGGSPLYTVGSFTAGKNHADPLSPSATPLFRRKKSKINTPFK